MGTPVEWLAMMADLSLAQSAVDRPASADHELIIEGESYRRRRKPTIAHAAGVLFDGEKGVHHDHP